MKTMRQLVSATLAAALGILAAGQPATAQSNSTVAGQIGPFEKADQVLGQQIKNSQGETIGTVNNLAVDIASVRILYAIVDVQGGNRVAIPADEFSTGANQTDLVVNVAKTNLANAPRFQGSQLANVSFAQQVSSYFGQQPWWQGPASSANSTTETFPNVHGSKQLIGTPVKDVSNQNFGQMKNLVVNLPAGHIVYVGFSPTGNLGAGNKVYLPPPNAFTPDPDGKTLVTGVDTVKLQSGPHFNSSSWPDVANSSYASQVYQYFGKQLYFYIGGQLSPTSNR